MLVASSWASTSLLPIAFRVERSFILLAKGKLCASGIWMVGKELLFTGRTRYSNAISEMFVGAITLMADAGRDLRQNTIRRFALKCYRQLKEALCPISNFVGDKFRQTLTIDVCVPNLSSIVRKMTKM